MMTEKIDFLERLTRCAVAGRDAILGRTSHETMSKVVRDRGGDRIFAVDEISEAAIIDSFQKLLSPGIPCFDVIMEGFEEPLVLGDSNLIEPMNRWSVIVDPLDGSRPWIVGKRSAWVIIGAGRGARTLDQLEIAVAVEVPADQRIGSSLIASVVRGELTEFFFEDLNTGTRTRFEARASESVEFMDSFVSVARFAAGNRTLLGAFEDAALSGLGCIDDAQASSMGQIIEVAIGRELAVIDPRPFFPGGGMTAHPYDLAGWLILDGAGGSVEALTGGPLSDPLDVYTGVAWAAFANSAVAAVLRPRIQAALRVLDS